ncbi:MAG: hypothetical protein ACLGXA_06480 [Acidobacteriota bacterium]
MANGDEKQEDMDETVLVAWVTVHLESGESFELLPFEDTEDVKRKVCDLMKAWAKSGFLIRGNQIYPWHRVRRVEAVKVEEMSRTDAQLRREEWQARETASLQQSFWKTKRMHPDKEESGGEKHEGDAPRMAA